MRIRSALHFPLIAVLCVGCIKNPARGLTPNDVDPVVEETSAHDREPGLYRGDEKLDEQDFYHIVGDAESEKTIKDKRSSGETRQSIGATLIGVGIGILGFGLASWLLPKGGVLGDKGLFEPFLPANAWLPYVIIGGGGISLYGGAALLKSGKEATSGKDLLFPLKHAQTSLEQAQYGGGGLKPENIQSLALTAAKGQSTYCGFSGVSLAPLIGKDEKGREVKLARHEDWLEWSTDPADLIVQEKSGSDTQQSYRAIRSPLRQSLDFVGKPVKVSVSLKGTNTSASLLLAQDLSCPEDVYFSGNGGSYGSSGSSGDSGSRGASGGPGGSGGDGGDGGDGLDVEVEAAWVKDKSGNRYALFAVKASGAQKPIAMLMDKEGKLGVISAGGSGGSGGDGGRGGSGSSSDSGKTPAYCAGDGGAGGIGGRGGRGGNGGHVVIRAVDETIMSQIMAGAPGGNGGRGGSAGWGGSRGSQYSECSKASSADGPRGAEGADGNGGREGSVKKQTVGAGSLSMITALLRDAPSLSLDTGGKAKK